MCRGRNSFFSAFFVSNFLLFLPLLFDLDTNATNLKRHLPNETFVILVPISAIKLNTVFWFIPSTANKSTPPKY